MVYEGVFTRQETRLLPATICLWRLSPAGERNLGLCCTENGLLLGRTPLIERHSQQYAIRPRSDLERVFKGFPAAPDLDRLLPGLTVVKAALDERNLCLA